MKSQRELPSRSSSGGSSSAPSQDQAHVQLKRALQGKGFAEQEAMLAPDVQRVASEGVSGGGGAMPFSAQIQQSFGHHDISGARAHVGGKAGAASEAIGAKAYATGSDVAFAGTPDLHTAAHEAAHLVQQKKGVQLSGGVGQAGDAYERHADAVADKVVAGESAAGLLDGMSGGGSGGAVQRYSKLPTAKQNATNYAVGEELRVSDDGKMAVPSDPNTHTFYAELGVLNRAQGQLASIGSPVSLAAGGASIQGRAPGGNKKSPLITLVEVVPTNARTATSGDQMETYENCNMNALETMGIDPRTNDGSKGIGRVDANGQAHAWNEDMDNKFGVGKGDMGDETMKQVRKDIVGTGSPSTDLTDRDEVKSAYEKMSPKKKRAAAAAHGANQSAIPTKAGQALQVWNGTLNKNKNEKTGKTPGKFDYHFAPVACVSGGDYVTLENFGKGNADVEHSKEWYWRMYGPVKLGWFGKVKEDQSFHGEQVASGEYGGEERTLTLLHEQVDRNDR